MNNSMRHVFKTYRMHENDCFGLKIDEHLGRDSVSGIGGINMNFKLNKKREEIRRC
jgi:hypothetical protein